MTTKKKFEHVREIVELKIRKKAREMEVDPKDKKI